MAVTPFTIHKVSKIVGLVLLLVFSIGQASADCPADISVEPLSATSMEQIVVTYCARSWEFNHDFGNSVSGNTVEVWFDTVSGIGGPDYRNERQYIGPLPPGDYIFNIRYGILGSQQTQTVPVTVVGVNAPTGIPTLSLSGLALLTLLMAGVAFRKVVS